MDVLAIETFLGKYAPYINITPEARLRVKNACPNAINTPLMVNLEKSISNINENAAEKSPTTAEYKVIATSKINSVGIK